MCFFYKGNTSWRILDWYCDLIPFYCQPNLGSCKWWSHYIHQDTSQEKSHSYGLTGPRGSLGIRWNDVTLELSSDWRDALMVRVRFRLIALLDCINGLLKGWLHISIWEKNQPWKLHNNTYWYDLAKFQLFENVIMSKECMGNVFKTRTKMGVLWCQVLGS